MKFEKELTNHKNKLIEDIKKIDKGKLFGNEKKPKLSFFDKLRQSIYGKR